MGRKKPGRKPEPKPKRRIAWPRWTGFRGMTLRDWLPLVGALLIPVVIAAGTWGITWQQGKIEKQRAEAERRLAEQRAQDEALQAYLDQMSNLLLERNLREAEPDSEVRTLARARTLTVLGRLDPKRKTEVMRFLVDADLVQRVEGRDPVIRLNGADLRAANLSDAVLRSQNRPGADLGLQGIAANLNGAELRDTDLSDTDLIGADLSYANLGGVNLSHADLEGANLSNVEQNPPPGVVAEFTHANLRDANLRNADLQLAILKDANLVSANLSGADLTDAKLVDATLSEANLSKADLSGANLSSADLSSNADAFLRGANLSGADLSGADLGGS